MENQESQKRDGPTQAAGPHTDSRASSCGKDTTTVGDAYKMVCERLRSHARAEVDTTVVTFGDPIQDLDGLDGYPVVLKSWDVSCGERLREDLETLPLISWDVEWAQDTQSNYKGVRFLILGTWARTYLWHFEGPAETVGDSNVRICFGTSEQRAFTVLPKEVKELLNATALIGSALTKNDLLPGMQPHL